jgi:hypothetical protein
LSKLEHFFTFAAVDSPLTAKEWSEKSEIERLSLVKSSLAGSCIEYICQLEPVVARSDGQVTFRMIGELKVGVRGGVLLDAEAWLKNTVDQGITVWVEPMGDRSSLRKLRGVRIDV